MAIEPQIVGTFFLLTGVTSLILLWVPLRYPDKPGSLGFTVVVLSISLWTFGLGVGKFLSDYWLSIVSYYLVLLAAELVTVGWFLLASEFTGWRRPSRRMLAVLGGTLLVLQLLIWTNPLHHFVLTPATTMDGTVIVPVYNTGFWLHTVVSYLLVMVGTVLLIADSVRSTGLRRRQSAVLALAVVPTFVANVIAVFNLAFNPYDVTPFGYLVTTIILGWVLSRGRFLEIAPVARRTAMSEMDDAVVTLDDENRIVDCNVAARHVFDLGNDYVGKPVNDILRPVATDGGVDIADAIDVDTEITLRVDGTPRHFSLAISPVTARAVDSRVMVLRDVTKRKRREETLAAREQELDLLRQVLTRVLRHNIRNELMAISANADLIADQDHDPCTEYAETIQASCDDLEELSSKARRIERIVAREDELFEYDLGSVVDRAVEEVRGRYPDVRIEVECPENCVVEAGRGLEAAIVNLVENAAEHNDSDDPWVRLRTTESSRQTQVIIEDNGPGIPQQEVTVIETGAETPLQHGSGIGLWLVNWVIENTDADITFDTDGQGTTVTISFVSGQ